MANLFNSHLERLKLQLHSMGSWQVSPLAASLQGAQQQRKYTQQEATAQTRMPETGWGPGSGFQNNPFPSTNWSTLRNT